MYKVKRWQSNSTNINNVSLLIEINFYQEEYKSLLSLKPAKKCLLTYQQLGQEYSRRNGEENVV